jgi:5'-nucleotidase
VISVRRRPLACLALGAGLLTGRLPGGLDTSAAGDAEGRVAEATIGTTPENLEDQSRLEPVAVRVIAINDLHGAISTGREIGGRAVAGAAFLAAHVNRLRGEMPGRTLVVHAGDAVSASPAVSALFQDEPAIAIMNAIGVDAGVIGNHELDEGLPELRRLLDGGGHPATAELTGCFGGAHYPTLAANAVAAETGAPILPPYHVFTVGGVQIGVIGVVTTETPRSVGPGAAGLRFLDEAATVRRYAAKLRDAGVGTIIVLAHLGGRVDPSTARVTGPVADLGRAVGELVDVIISAHTHLGYVTMIGGALVTQAWAYGDAAAAIDVEIDPGSGRVVTKRARLVRTWNDEVAPDPTVAEIVARYERLAAPVVQQVIGAAGRAITRAPSEAGEQALGDFIADAYRWRTGADVACAHPGWNWADLAAGKVTWGDLFLVQPATRDLVTLQLTGDQIVRFLDEQWRPERTTQIQVSGLEIDVDITRPIGRRITASRAGGRPLDPEATYTVTMDAYLAGGGDLFTVPLESKRRVTGPKDLATLIDYVRYLPQPFAAPVEGRIHRALVAAGAA